MDPSVIQNLRYKLQKRARRLNSVDPPMFPFALTQFWAFFNGQPTYCGIAEMLELRFPNMLEKVEGIFTGSGYMGNTEDEAAAVGLLVLRRLAQTPADQITTVFHQVARLYRGGRGGQLSEALETIRDVFLDPFYEYVDEQLDDQRAMLSLLLRYKHRSEWFYRQQLWKLASESQKGEKLLALDLYAYLYDQGINFAIEPSSLSGAIDLIAAQHTDDPLLLDAKIFDGDSRSRSYLRSGFNQIYTYTQQHNEPFGYLVIFKTTDKDLRLSLVLPSRDVPVVVHNHKTIFLITIDIYPHERPVSKRSALTAVEITEEDLVEIIKEAAEQGSDLMVPASSESDNRYHPDEEGQV